MKKIVILIILFYKKFLSPLLPGTCRFYPTCSTYSIAAIKKYGLLRGGLKGSWRLLRCNPFNRGGYDPLK